MNWQLKALQDTAGHAKIGTTVANLIKTCNERYDEIVRSANGKDISWDARRVKLAPTTGRSIWGSGTVRCKMEQNANNTPG